MQTHTIEIDHVIQRFHVMGGGPVCLVHPGGPGIGWEYLRMPLLERRLTLVYVEPIGTGCSGRLSDPRGYTIERYARRILGIFDYLGLPQAHVLGHSHGGFVAQRFAIDHADRLASLVLYATSPLTGGDFIADAAANIARIATRSGDGQLRAAFDEVWAAGDDATFTRLFRAIFPAYFFDYEGRAKEIEAMRSALVANWDPMRGESPKGPFDVRSELASLRVPTLIAGGRHDFICGPRWTALLASALPHAETITFEQSGHMPHLEEGEEFSRVVADFVTSH
jgi:pimeloyl-ACP methyl ester carboxylesterase